MALRRQTRSASAIRVSPHSRVSPTSSSLPANEYLYSSLLQQPLSFEPPKSRARASCAWAEAAPPRADIPGLASWLHVLPSHAQAGEGELVFERGGSYSPACV